MLIGVSAAALTALASASPALAQDTTTANTDASKKVDSVAEVVVTGQRASLRSAQTIKMKADQIVDSITAVDIGALPDRSVTEALQRIPGVTITRTSDPRDADRISVEGGGVQIRGLSYVRSEFDGRDAFSAVKGRSLSFDDVPAELMAGVDVYKNPSAELIEGGVGGTVNLRTRLPFDQSGPLVGYSVDGTYGDLAKSWKPSGSLLLSDRWETKVGQLGLLVDFSDSNFESRTDTFSVDPYYTRTDLVAGKTVYVPGGFGYRSLTFDRERQGLDIAAQWRPTSNLLVTAQFIRSASYSTENENAVGIDTSASTYPAAGTNFTYNAAGLFTSGTFAGSSGGSTVSPDVLDERYNTTHSVTSDYSINAKWNATSRLVITADVQYVRATTKANDFTLFDSLNGSLGAPTLDLTGRMPHATIPTSSLIGNAADYYWDAAMEYNNRNEGEEWAERIDGSYTFDGDWLKDFRFGVRHTGKTVTTRETPYNWGYVSQTWSGAGLALLNGTGPTSSGNSIPAALMPLSNFFRGQISVPANFYASTASFLANHAAAVNAILAAENRASSCCGPWSPFTGDYNAYTSSGGLSGINHQREQTTAAFGLLTFGHDLNFAGHILPMDGNVGIRIVNTDARSQGLGAFAECTGVCLTSFPTAAQTFLDGSTTVVAGGRDYTNALPSLNVRFKLRPDLFLRIAASKSIVRPDFSQMLPSVNVTATGGYTNGGTTCNQTSSTTNAQQNCLYNFTSYAGNPDLKPVRANSYDLALEWYFNNTGSLTGTIFRKDIYNFITSGSIYKTVENNGVSESVLETGPYNAGHGTVDGFEVAYQQYFSFLPGVLRGVGVQANYTYVDSEGARNASADPYDSTQITNSGLHLPLEGLSRNAYNIAGLYDLGPISARLSYSWREKYLLTTSAANINIPAWAGDFGQLDASVFYTISPKLKLGLQVANITDSIYKVLVSYPTGSPGLTGHNWIDADRRFTVVLRGQF